MERVKYMIADSQSRNLFCSLIPVITHTNPIYKRGAPGIQEIFELYALQENGNPVEFTFFHTDQHPHHETKRTFILKIIHELDWEKKGEEKEGKNSVLVKGVGCVKGESDMKVTMAVNYTLDIESFQEVLPVGYIYNLERI